MNADARPLLRGVLHQGALAVAIVVGVVLVAETDGGRRIAAAAAFAASAVTMLAISTAYHRITWTPRARLWMRRADHAGIYILIAGTYTPVGLLALHGALQTVVLAIVWAGAATAILLKLVWVHAPKWLSVVIAVALGWVGVAAIPAIIRADGVTPVVLIAAGGLAYTLGGIVYGLRRPDPFPRVFGYHELFHALTLVGLALQYVAIVFFVV
ncbi:MAG: hemolysin III family protein [Actinomycetota bacterium]